jgi:Flp pilus assembly protein TadG
MLISSSSSPAFGRRTVTALRRLVRNDSGNVLILSALMLMPLIALVGSAIDLGRAQLAQSRLQLACDAASLAGRRAMSNGAVDAPVRAEIQKFFQFNFPQGAYQTQPFTLNITSSIGGAPIVTIAVSTTIPTTIMKLWGHNSIPVAVTCNANQDFTNTDIVLVLDTTGSMADKAVSTDTDTKIVALRKAVLAFYDQMAPVQAQLTAANLRLRFGIVPYSSSVNVGKAIRGVNTSYMLSGNTPYQSRRIASRTDLSDYQCGNIPGSYSGGTCKYFTYGRYDVDTTAYLQGGTIDMTPIIGRASTNNAARPSNTQSSQMTSWKGCIEERQTTTMLSTATAIPGAAYDLDITRIPTDDPSRWKAYWPEAEYMPNGSKPQVACPAEAAPMKVWTHAEMSTYLDSLQPDGGTYHDNGMMWGARWAAPQGIFASSNPSVFAALPVKRYIIFMTDGAFDTGYDGLYTTYGMERYDRRVTGGTDEADQLARHKNRFDLLCSRAKEEPLSYSIWVVAFAQALDNSMINCASPGQASTSANSAALTAKFGEIAHSIGALRLTR